VIPERMTIEPNGDGGVVQLAAFQARLRGLDGAIRSGAVADDTTIGHAPYENPVAARTPTP
jgi:hypothetical protein